MQGMIARPLGVLWRPDVIVPVVALLVAAAIRVPSLGQPLLEAHGFRQTQTAYTALIYHEQGIELFRPQIPVFGPPWVVPFEFPLFQAGGALLMDLGLPPDVAMRTLGLACFLLTGCLLYRLAARIGGAIVAAGTLVAFLFSPFATVWGRTSTVEYAATAGGIAFLLAGTAWLDTRRLSYFAAALLAGSVAVLVKVTTGALFLVPLLTYRGAWREPRIWVLIIVPLAFVIAWNGYADAVKAASEATAWLTTAELRSWFFGELADRFESTTWNFIVANVVLDLTGLALVVWAPLAVLGSRTSFTRALLIMSVLPLVIITPLYREHSYYLAAISPFIALGVGLGAAWLWRHRTAVAARTAGAILAGLWVAAFLIMPERWTLIYQPVVDPDRTLAAASYVAERSEAGDVVAIAGRDWNPAIWYYARRRGIAVIPQVRAIRYDVAFDCTDACKVTRPSPSPSPTPTP